MTEYSMKTYSTKASDLKPAWHVIDASGRTLGRLASEVATLLMGKRKPIYTPHLNTGDFVVVLNASKVRVTGRKAEQKTYYRHSGYPGGLKSVTYTKLMETHPTRVIEHAVKGMLPHNRLGRDMLRRLKVYAGDVHPHEAQVGSRSRAKTEEGGGG
jgi:large subunit ribosomal protein L13